MKWCFILKVALFFFWTVSPLLAKGENGFEVSLSYWRITDALTQFKEGVSESERYLGTELLGLDGLSTTTSLLEIESDPSKYLIDASYRFVDSLYRLKVGVQYASSGNDKVDEVSLIKQSRDLLAFVNDFNFEARRLVYSNFYASYRLLPMEGDLGPEDVDHRGLDIWLSFTELEQEFQFNNRSFSASNQSFGIGVGGSRTFNEGRLKVTGRVIYLPFYDVSGVGWDSEFQISYEYSDMISLYLGGKWYSVSLDAQDAVDFTGIMGFSEEIHFQEYEAKLGGYTLGVSFSF